MNVDVGLRAVGSSLAPADVDVELFGAGIVARAIRRRDVWTDAFAVESEYDRALLPREHAHYVPLDDRVRNTVLGRIEVVRSFRASDG